MAVSLGVLLMQFAWILAVPPFYGIDEIDHVYRSASVARGAWSPSREIAPNGRGGVVTVPLDIVERALPRCEELPYMQEYNCRPMAGSPPGSARVVTAASTQSPWVYAWAGTAALPFTGSSANYAMRFAVAIPVALMIGLAAMVLTQGARTLWPLVGLACAVTPVFVYSSVVPAGNGWEIGAGLLAWSCVMALGRDLPRGTERGTLWVLVGAVSVLVSLRQLGPLWALMIAGFAVAWWGWGRLRRLVRDHVSVAIIGATVVALLVAIHAAWIVAAGYGERVDRVTSTHEWTDYPVESLLWFIQSIATGSFRNVPAPAPVYAIYLIVLVPVVYGAFRMAPRGQRSFFTSLLVVCLAFPVLFTELTYSTLSGFWQGRYGLPFTLGVLVVAAEILEGRMASHRLLVPALRVGAVLLATAAVVSVVAVMRTEGGRESITLSEGWWPHPTWLVVLLVCSGWAVAVFGGVRAVRRTQRDEIPVHAA